MFDDDIVNEYGKKEEPIIYILRHTQLLPRQLITILESLIKASQGRTGGWRELKSELVAQVVGENESKVASEILGAYRYVFPAVERIGRTLFGNFTTTFSFDSLHAKWRQSGRPANHVGSPYGVDFAEIMDMFLRVGVVGIIDGNETDLYIPGLFSYNQAHHLIPPNIGAGNSLCVHPIFSRYFRCSSNGIRKAVLPHGVM